MPNACTSRYWGCDMVNIDKQNQRVRKLINQHEHWKAQWKKRDMLFSMEMISPQGKVMTCNAYQFEVDKHLDSTVNKIRKVLGV